MIVLRKENDDLMVKGGVDDEKFFEVQKEKEKQRLDYLDGQNSCSNKKKDENSPKTTQEMF